MNLDRVVERLNVALARPLPGQEALLRMARRPRPGWVPGASVPGCRDGAVLLLLYPKGGAAHVVFTLRSGDLQHHRSQVSLPGGRVEDGETIVEAAMREAHEEVGVDTREIVPLGQTTPFHLPVSSFIVHPVVAAAKTPLAFRAASPEVERILEVPLDDLLDPACVRLESRALDGVPTEVPYFHLAGEKVWGATAMVLSELLEMLGVVVDPRRDRSPHLP